MNGDQQLAWAGGGFNWVVKEVKGHGIGGVHDHKPKLGQFWGE